MTLAFIKGHIIILGEEHEHGDVFLVNHALTKTSR